MGKWHRRVESVSGGLSVDYCVVKLGCRSGVVFTVEKSEKGVIVTVRVEWQLYGRITTV